jgi:hypothetical protein
MFRHHLLLKKERIEKSAERKILNLNFFGFFFGRDFLLALARIFRTFVCFPFSLSLSLSLLNIIRYVY